MTGNQEKLSAAKRLLSELYDSCEKETCDVETQTTNDGYAIVNGNYQLISLPDFLASSNNMLIPQMMALMKAAVPPPQSPPPQAPASALASPAITATSPATSAASMPMSNISTTSIELLKQINSPVPPSVSTGAETPESRKGMSKRMKLMAKLAKKEGFPNMSTRELLEMYKGITIPQIYELLTTAKTRGPLIDNGMRPLDADEYRDLSADKKRQYTARVIEIVNNTKDGDRLDLKQYARDYGIPYSTFIEHYRGKKPNPYIINTLLAHS